MIFRLDAILTFTETMLAMFESSHAFSFIQTSNSVNCRTAQR